MEQFSKVIHELRAWLTANKLIAKLLPYRLILLFGGLGIIFFQQLLNSAIPNRFYDVHRFLSFVFYDIPIVTIAHFAFLLGVWLTLVSKDVKMVAYGLWINVFITLFPFRSFRLSTLITVAIYAFLGYLIFKYADSHHGKLVANEPLDTSTNEKAKVQSTPDNDADTGTTTNL